MHILSAFSVVQFNEAGNFIHNMKEWASNAQIDEVFTNPFLSGNDQMLCTFSILLHCKASYMTVYLAQSFLIHSNFKVTSERMLSRYSLFMSATSALLCCSNLS